MRKVIQRVLIILLAIWMLCGTAAMAVSEENEIISGVCGVDGDNVTWTLNTESGDMTIRGKGYMANYYSYKICPPWDAYRELIRTISIERGVNNIGTAFYNCANLVCVTIPSSVQLIDIEAFSGCVSLANVSIPSSVTFIGGAAFYGCTSLSKIAFADDVTEIGRQAFSETAYYNNAGNWQGDVLYIGKYLIAAKPSLAGAYTVADNTICIANAAFDNCTQLTSVTMPDSVMYIGSDAFLGCTNLTGVTLPDGVSRIRSQLFYGCNSLVSVTIPDRVTDIDIRAFCDCESLKNVIIPESVIRIGTQAFAGCLSLTDVTIPAGVRYIGEGPFSRCTSLSGITVDAQNEAFRNDGYGVLYDIQYTHLIQFAAGSPHTKYTIPDSVKYIGSFAFYYCKSLKSVTITDHVTGFGDCVFYNCTDLESMTIPDSVTEIGDWTFCSCEKMSSVTIGNGVTHLDNSVFRNCKSLTGVTIPESVMSIGVTTFLGSGLTSVTIPDGVTSIGWHCFSDCEDLERVTLPRGITSIDDGAFKYCSSLKKICYDGTPESREMIMVGADNEELFLPAWYYHSHDPENAERIGAVEATCTTEGYTGDIGFECGIILEKGEVIPAKGHTFGVWNTTKLPTEFEEGEEERACLVCGEIETRVLEKLPCELLVLNRVSVVLHCKETETLVASEPVKWSSSDERVVKVDADGIITAVRRGTAVITAYSEQSGQTAVCTVTVKYTWWQWLLVIILFGWIWF